jgi:hypothetical protein
MTGTERAFAAALVATLPALCAFGVALSAQLAGITQAGQQGHFVALFLGWIGAAGYVVRSLRRRWSHSARPSFAHLLLAASVSFGAAVGIAVLTSPWQDLMSELRPTPLMVIEDLIAAFAPIGGAFLAPWLVLAPATASAPTTGQPHGRHAA